MDRQHETKELSQVANQELNLAVKRPIIVADESQIARLKSPHAAFVAMVSSSGLNDQEICTALDMDKGQWSRICSGSAHFPMNLFGPLFDICGSELFLQYLAYSRGYEATLHKRKSELEKRLEQVQAELDEERLKNKHFMEAFKGAANG